MLLLPWITLFILVKSWLKSGKNRIESKGVRKLKTPEFWVCRHKCRGIAVALPSRAAALLPGNLAESSQGAGRGIGLGRAASLTSRMLFLGF